MISYLQLLRDRVRRAWVFSCLTRRCHSSASRGYQAYFGGSLGCQSWGFLYLLLFFRELKTAGQQESDGYHDPSPGQPVSGLFRVDEVIEITSDPATVLLARWCQPFPMSIW